MIFVKEPIPETGDVDIERDFVIGNFRNCEIVQHGGSFRLINKDKGTRLSISPEDALWMIDALGLAVSCSDLMGRVCIWKEQLNYLAS